ncbi:hypothetical protein PRN20_09180 [Devosia sp. ZB163]|uniref:hypothetical protein n=1 Tax=Devosia sp. ZB163 TaxID=3025938 RepID=UPI00235FB884|nr:hypothetical protein [Devosia sp. ZB163]MDC9823906.1 hypothetical protein [Devosia sp. ZB163]
MQIRFVAAALAGLIGLSAVPPALAQTPADTAGFSQACLGGATFLLGQVPEGADATTILTPLCGCLGTAFKDMSQKDIDMLAADLRGEGTDEAHTAHGNYQGLTELAREGLNNCFASPEVVAAMQAAQPPAAETTPATPQ